MRISSWSSDVCSSVLAVLADREFYVSLVGRRHEKGDRPHLAVGRRRWSKGASHRAVGRPHVDGIDRIVRHPGKEDCLATGQAPVLARFDGRWEEHTSELQSLMRISYAVVCLKKKQQNSPTTNNTHSPFTKSV